MVSWSNCYVPLKATRKILILTANGVTLICPLSEVCFVAFRVMASCLFRETEGIISMEDGV